MAKAPHRRERTLVALPMGTREGEQQQLGWKLHKGDDQHLSGTGSIWLGPAESRVLGCA